MKKIFFILIALFLLIGCTREADRALSRSFGTNSDNRRSADRYNDVEEIWKVQDADKRLQDMHWFEDTYQQIQAYTIQVESETNVERANAVKTVLNRRIGEYNSRMRQYDRAMWANNGLPEKIEMVK